MPHDPALAALADLSRDLVAVLFLSCSGPHIGTQSDLYPHFYYVRPDDTAEYIHGLLDDGYQLHIIEKECR